MFFRAADGERTEPSAKRMCTDVHGPPAALQGETETAHQEQQRPLPDTDSDCRESMCSSSYMSSGTSTDSSSTAKQSRRFRKVWLTGREHWLEYSIQERGMFCSLCRKYNKRPYNNDVWNTQLKLELEIE